MKPTMALLALALAIRTTGHEPMLILNEDNDHYFKQPAARMNLADLQAYIDRLAGTKVTHLFLCPNGQRTSYRSNVHEAIWDDVAGQPPDNIWCTNAKLLHDQGIDPYAVWIARCRERGISPWITMRMNDVHFVTTPNYFRNTTFWRTRSDLWRVSNAVGGAWTDFAFDYAKPEVREYHLALVRELLERYDMDGLELDWMRFGRHLTPGKEAELAPVLTEFTRQVREMASEWADRRGHPIRLGARLPAHPDAAAGLGMDGIEWGRQGLVDLLVPSPFFTSADFDIPVALWRERLGEHAATVAVVPAIDNGTSAHPGAPRVDIDLATYYGWATSLHARGAGSFYLFNLVYRPQDRPPYRTILDHGLEESVVRNARRRHPLAYRDTVPDGFPNNAQLPGITDRPLALRIDIGRAPVAASVFVVLGLATPPTGQDATPAVALNDHAATASTELLDAKAYGGAKTLRALRFSLPADALRDGWNTIAVAPTPAAPQRLVWAEIDLRP